MNGHLYVGDETLFLVWTFGRIMILFTNIGNLKEKQIGVGGSESSFVNVESEVEILKSVGTKSGVKKGFSQQATSDRC